MKLIQNFVCGLAAFGVLSFAIAADQQTTQQTTTTDEHGNQHTTEVKKEEKHAQAPGKEKKSKKIEVKEEHKN